ncbi:MAG: hypothetical protein ACPGQS_06965 [Bradymonadia bacterium]
MNSTRLITLSVLVLFQMGCFESFEEAISGTDRVFTCPCIGGYKCIAVEGEADACVRAEDARADMDMPAPDMQRAQPDTGSDMSTEDAEVIDTAIPDTEVIDAAIPDMDVMDAARPDAQIVDSCIPQLDTVELDILTPPTDCPVDILDQILGICRLDECVNNMLDDCRIVFEMPLSTERDMLTAISRRFSTLRQERGETPQSCGEVLGSHAKAFFQFVQTGLGDRFQSHGCTGAQGNLRSCETGPFQGNPTIGGPSPLAWTSESTIKGYATGNDDVYREVDGFNNVIELSPQQRGKILWSLRLPPGVDAVSHIQVSLQDSAATTLIGNGTVAAYRYSYAVQTNSELCLPPVFEHGGSNQIEAPPVAESVTGAVAQTLSFGSGVSRAVPLSERTELGVLLGGAAYEIKVEIQNPSETTLKFSLDRTAIVPVTFFDASATYDLIGFNCLPFNYLDRVCDSLVSDCNSAAQENCNTEASGAFCDFNNLTAFAEDVFYSAFAYDSDQHFQGNYYQCVNRTDCGHSME